MNLAWTEHPNHTKNVYPQGPCDCGSDLTGATDLGVVDRWQCHDIPQVTVTIKDRNVPAKALGG